MSRVRLSSLFGVYSELILQIFHDFRVEPSVLFGGLLQLFRDLLVSLLRLVEYFLRVADQLLKLRALNVRLSDVPIPANARASARLQIDAAVSMTSDRGWLVG